MTGAQVTALRLLHDADGMVDTHQMRLKLTVASGGRREWTYDRTHALLVRLHQGGLVLRAKPSDGSVSRWSLTDKGRERLTASLM